MSRGGSPDKAPAPGPGPRLRDGRPLVFFVLSRLLVLMAVTLKGRSILMGTSSPQYIGVAQHGYQVPGSFECLPVYPLLVHAANWLFHNVWTAGVVVSLTSFALMLWMVFQMGCELVGDEAALAAVALYAFFPTSWLESSVGPDALLLLMMVAAHKAARQDRWPLAGLFGFVACLTRLVGLLVVIPLAVEYFVQKRNQWRELAWLLVIPMGLAFYLLYAAQNGGNPLVVLSGHDFNRGCLAIAQTVSQACAWHSFPDNLNALLDTTVLLLVLGAVAASFRVLPWGFRAHLMTYGLVLVVLASTMPPSQSVLLLFPAFLVWGSWLKSPATAMAVTGVSGGLLGVLASGALN